MTKEPADFQVFIKPVGARCNLACRYCYYLDKKDLVGKGSGIMTDQILEKCIIQQYSVSVGNTVMFSLHGGEPLLAGIDFYRKALSLQKKHKPKGASFLNGIQTNGTLLTPEWCKFLASARFNVGVSLDGPENMHDLFRKSATGKSTFNEVVDGIILLRKHGINPEILCVVNAENSKYPLEVYDFFKSLGVRHISFLPLVVKDGQSPHGVSGTSVTPEAFGSFLVTIFDKWVSEDIGKVKIQIIEEALRTAFDQEHTLCIFREECGRVPVLEHNGDFYSCDHYVNKENFLGNILEKNIPQMLNSAGQTIFGRLKERLPEYCLKCEVKKMCNGECPKNRFVTTPDGEPGLNYLCEGYKMFFGHLLPFVDAIKKVDSM